MVRRKMKKLLVSKKYFRPYSTFKYTINLTEMARNKKLDPIIGREIEIKKTIQILSRKAKRNPLLLSDAGCGKTSIVEGLAQYIVNGNVPDNIKEKEILAVDVGELLAGQNFEEKIKYVIEKVGENENNILFIDEIHSLIHRQGTLSGLNLMKPALARGSIRCIAATTFEEYKKSIEKDAALVRRFNPIRLSEPDVYQTLIILKGIKNRYEEFHRVVIPDETLDFIVKKCHQYIKDRHFPDKAIDIMDEAASSIYLQEMKPDIIINVEKQLDVLRESLAPTETINEKNLELSRLVNGWQISKRINKEIRQISSELLKSRQQLEEAKRVNDFEKVSQLSYGIIPDLIHQIDRLNNSKPSDLFGSNTVSIKVAAQVLADKTGIPLDNLLIEDRHKLLNIEQYLCKEVVGQEHAIKAVANCIRIAKTGLRTGVRPLGCFLMLGQTGVGKTLLCKSLNKFLFGNTNSIIRLDMAEYMDKYSVSRMIGASPGLVGYEEGGALTEAVKRKPASVVLFDEIEKADRQINNILLSIMDEGRLTDCFGKTVDFTNTIIALTSNLCNDLSRHDHKDKVFEKLNKHFAPEFINRLDDIILFNPLDSSMLESILTIELDILHTLLAEKVLTISISSEVKAFLLEKGYNPQYGARPLKRAINYHLISPLSLYILKHDPKPNSKIEVCLVDEKLKFNQTLLLEPPI